MPRHVAIATPCYGNAVFTNYLLGMIKLMVAWKAGQFGDTHFSFLVRGGDSLIPRVRNSIVAEFLSKPEYTHLLWIDADIGFSPEDVLRLLDSGHDVAAGIYPLKRVNLPDALPAMTAQQFKAVTLGFPLNPTGVGYNIGADGFVEVLDAPTGLMLIKREVLTRMAAHYPELKYKPDTMLGLEGLAGQIDDHYYRLFDVMVDETGRYLSEDYAFGRRWQAMGGKVHADVRGRLSHQGQYLYEGNVLQTLMARHELFGAGRDPQAEAPGAADAA